MYTFSPFTSSNPTSIPIFLCLICFYIRGKEIWKKGSNIFPDILKLYILVLKNTTRLIFAWIPNVSCLYFL